MERKFITFEGWDQHDTMCFGFTDCVVVTPFGPYAVDDKLEAVTVDYGKGTIEVWKDDLSREQPDWTGKLSLSIE